MNDKGFAAILLLVVFIVCAAVVVFYVLDKSASSSYRPIQSNSSNNTSSMVSPLPSAKVSSPAPINPIPSIAPQDNNQFYTQVGKSLIGVFK